MILFIFIPSYLLNTGDDILENNCFSTLPFAEVLIKVSNRSDFMTKEWLVTETEGPSLRYSNSRQQFLLCPFVPNFSLEGTECKIIHVGSHFSK